MPFIKKILFILTTQDKKKIIILLAMIFIMAMVEMLGVASIMPFITVITNPELIKSNNILSYLYEISRIIGVENENEFLFFLGILVFFLLILSLSLKSLVAYVELHFSATCEFNLSKRLVEGYLHQPYSWFLNRNSSELGKTILSEVNTVIGNGVSPLIILVTNLAIIFMIVSLIIFVNPELAFYSFFTLSITYGLIYKFSKKIVMNIGAKRYEANQKRFSIIFEAFGAVKEVKAANLEKVYVNRFNKPALNYSNYQALLGVIGQLPRYAIEAIAFGGIVLLTLFLLNENKGYSNIFPIIGLYAFAGYRMLPALQKIYFSMTNLRSVIKPMQNIYEDLYNLSKLQFINDQVKNDFVLKDSIILDKVSYNYPNSDKKALDSVTIKIQAKKIVGLIGSTGSGKTTTVDVILGLLKPQKGRILIDGKLLNQNSYLKWKKSIGYVPQQIYLADDSIYSNIAFGVDYKNINEASVKRAAKTANLHEFIINDLPENYKTKVGERGIRLSGGQRQRIGIARALYHSPSVLIFDEATNALDNQTENAIMDDIYKISDQITVIIISHRLSTVEKCDKIYLLEKGKIKSEGTFQEMLNNSYYFKSYKKGD